jgi:hypothetical protein
MYARSTLPPAINYAHQAHVDITVPTYSSEIENYNRQECRDEVLDKIGWSKNGLLADLRRRLLQHYKLKRT